MGVCIWKCNKDQDNIVKESSIDCFKKSEQSIFANVITSNNIYEDKKLMKIKYKKLFNDTKDNKEKENINIISPLNNNQNINYTFSNNATASNSTWNEKYVKNVIKIQNFYRNHIRRKTNKNKLMINKDKEDTNIFLKLNLEMVETVHSSNSLNNSNISRENINNGEEGGDYKIIEKCRGYKGKEYKEIINNDIIHFNIKNKLSYMHYKYSGYVKRKTKILLADSPQIKTDNSNSIEEKEIFDNEEKSGLIKEGFGKFIFNDGSEFCGIFHNNILENYGKFTNINQKNNNSAKEVGKEIIIDNINYEEFIGIYKNYIPDGFGIYKNLITNLQITGIYDNKGIYGIGIENSVEGSYIYKGEFKNNKKEGYGTIIWKDGCRYQGEFKDNQMNGIGMIEFSGKNFYQGEIRNGKMEGFGEFFWNDKRKYFGYYKNDKRHGFGIYITKINDPNLQRDSDLDNDFDNINTSTFIGFWKNGNMDGLGMRIINSEIKYGIWENGFRKKYIENNLAQKTYAKYIDVRYNKLFFSDKPKINDFLKDIFNINCEI